MEGQALTVRRETAGREVPERGAVVAAVITRVNPRFASCRILTIGPSPVKETFSGIIRCAPALSRPRPRAQR